MAASSGTGRSTSKASMSCIQSVRDYISRMASEVSGMKVLIMDQETTGIVSMVYTQTQILQVWPPHIQWHAKSIVPSPCPRPWHAPLCPRPGHASTASPFCYFPQHEVFLIDSIESQTERKRASDKMAHLKALYFVRPTHDNIRMLKDEFKDPKYGEYHVYFSNTVRDGMIQQLAEADEHEVVQAIQEYYADFLAINSDCLSLGIPSVARLTAMGLDQPTFDRMQQGVCAALLALKKRPLIRYQCRSETATRVAESVLSTIDQEAELFHFGRPDVPPLLLLLDRRDDPVTPLLNQWTYQAMVHELIGISNNRVDLRDRPGVPKELEQVVLSMEQDAFFAANMYLNYGDLAEEVKVMMDAFQAKTKSSKAISSHSASSSFSF